MGKKSHQLLRYAAILFLILLISIFHYQTATEYRYLHEVYQRVYYLPILLAAFWYGPWGGLLAAAFTSTIYIFHIQRDWAHFPMYTFNQYAEIVLYHIVAFLMGFLSRRERRHRERLERTSRELAEAYQTLKDTFEHLRRADRLASLGQLSAGIAHEIRNPLGSIKGSIEILEKDLPPDSDKTEFVAIIKEEISRLNGLVAEFLAFARPPAPRIETVSVNDLIDSTLRLVQEQAKQGRVQINTELDSSLPRADLDPDQIRQVLLNLLLNAIEATTEEGMLTVRSSQTEKMIVLEVSDSGKGVEDKNWDRMFDPFFTTKSQGTGLGLSVSHQLVANHGGRISARRNPNRGMTFQVELPRDGVHQSTQRSRAASDKL